MNILVVGSGAREHALVWKLKSSNKVKNVFCAPGNAGIQQVAECVNIEPDDINGLLDFANEKKIDLTVVGPEVPLVMGIVDLFEENGHKIFGPNKKAAQLEGSKIFAKDFMRKYDIPTAKYDVFDEGKRAINALDEYEMPVVIKADGLAAGKGVVICQNKEEAITAITQMLENKSFGKAGEKIVIEEFLEGTEMSLLCFVDGQNIIPMESARDYKKIFDNDKGLNTGGMGCFSPNRVLSDELQVEIKKKVLDRFMDGLEAEEIAFKGVIFIGFMVTDKGSKVLEFNVRFGDPETEVVIPRLKSDLVDIMEKTIDGTLKAEDLVWTDKEAVCVVLASGGYPVAYEKGKVIKGLDKVKDVLVFHGGTKFQENDILTNGGRVLAITAIDNDIEKARKKVYEQVKKIDFDGMYFRSDIATL